MYRVRQRITGQARVVRPHRGRTCAASPRSLERGGSQRLENP